MVPAQRVRSRGSIISQPLAATALIVLVASSCLVVAVVGKVGPTRALRGGDSACPGSPSLIHAKCKISVYFDQPCAAVEAVMDARIAAVHDCKSRPGLYKGSARFGSRTTGDGKYTDLFKSTLAPAHGGGCTLTACSESQVTSVVDFSTNFCNLFNLYGNNSSPLTFTERLDSCPQHDKASCCRVLRAHTIAMRTRGRRPQREKVGARPQAEDNAYWTRWADWLDSRSPPPSPSPDSSLTTPEAESAVALGALGATAIVSEGIQLVGTGALIYLAKEFAGASDLPGAVDYLSSYFQGLGLAGYALYGAIMAFLQVVPLASAFVLTVSSGVIFGSTAKATALVSAASTSSAAVAFVIARYVLRERLLEVASENKTVLALDRALSKADFRSSLLVIMLLRSSPLLPFSWASYLFGISTVPFSAYILGSWLGTLPAIFAYVQVGELGSEAALSGHPPSWLVYFGIAATLAAITLVGDLASKTLKDLDIDLQD